LLLVVVRGHGNYFTSIAQRSGTGSLSIDSLCAGKRGRCRFKSWLSMTMM
jgi:hypothetical protein